MKNTTPLWLFLATALTTHAMDNDLKTVICQASNTIITLSNVTPKMKVETLTIDNEICKLRIAVKQEDKYFDKNFDLEPADNQQIDHWIESLRSKKLIKNLGQVFFDQITETTYAVNIE